MKDIKYCQWCFKPLINSHSVIYCNSKCQNNYQYMNNFLDWYICGNNNVSNRIIRKHLETIFGHKCSNCNITEWNNKPIVFDVEHKDGNSNNNKPNNVVLLCQNCHSQTKTYKNKNIGNGRFLLSIKNKGIHDE
ncbi:TPA: hypothetical protein NV714_001693 [Escherichia coli]|jgi:hypothetical protein|nr:hypothetical protein [Escherichia coli]